MNKPLRNAVVVSGTLMLVSAVLAGLFVGVEMGIDIALTSGGKERFDFGNEHLNVYREVYTLYFWQMILAGVIVVTILSLEKSKLVLVGLALCLCYPALNLVLIKYDLWSRDIEYGGVMVNTGIIDAVCLLLVLLLIAMSVIQVIKDRRSAPVKGEVV